MQQLEFNNFGQVSRSKSRRLLLLNDQVGSSMLPLSAIMLYVDLVQKIIWFCKLIVFDLELSQVVCVAVSGRPSEVEIGPSLGGSHIGELYCIYIFYI